MVTITPQALPLLPNGIGYLNVWVDSNRDGDWADRFECPQDATGVAAQALEHIVIDYAVDANALGVGQQSLLVTTSVPVWWPADLAQQPSWLRATLSDRPSNKPFITYGDGRGYDTPFRTGETEDYLLRGQIVDPTADPSVTKRGEIWPDFDAATNQRRWVIGWIVNYANGGASLANNVHVIDSYGPPQTLLAEHSIPLYAPTISGNSLDYNIGTLPAGGGGLVILRTSVPWTTPPGTVITNSVIITSANDTDITNNSTTVSVTVPVLPPVIVSPVAGSTCTGTVTIDGWVQPGAVVDIYVDGTAVATDISTDTHGNGNGDWSYVLTLADGAHDIYAVARAGGVSSDPSPTVHLIVDSTLFWDPISLRFEDENGHVIVPSGRLDESGWQVFLRPGHTYTVSLRVCCADPNAQVTLEIGDDIVVELTDPDNDHIYTGTFSIAVGGRMSGNVRICVTCNLIRRCTDGQVTIDPEGTVFDVTSGQPIDAALVSCMQSPTGAASADGVFVLWPAELFDQVNPQEVANDGYFSFFTPAGVYRLDVAKTDYQPYTSPDLTVVDAPVHFDVPLTPVLGGEADVQISISDGGFEPSVVTVAPGATIEWINADAALHSSTSITPSVEFQGPAAASLSADSGAWDSGLLASGATYRRQLNTVGTYTYRDVNNPDLTATIIVEEADTSLRLYLPGVAK
ncbi:MAG: GEVED domain-containing protein [Caldilineaceae bacterium]